MNDFEFDSGIKMVRLGDDGGTYYNGELTPEDIALKKRASRIMSNARKNAKLQHCFFGCFTLLYER